MKKPIKILSLVLAVGLLAACSGNNPTSKKPSGDDDSGFSFNDTELNTAQEIHDANQKRYLNLGIQYYNITEANLQSCNVDGRSNKSAPKQVEVKWDFDANGETVTNYSFTYGQKEDLSDGYTFDVGTTPSAKFYNPYIGDNYFKVTATLDDGSTVESPIKIFKVETEAPRNIYAGNMPNVRDMGGRTTYAGGKIKQGLIYRGAGNRFDNSSQVNSECTDVLRNVLKIKTEINVANGDGNNIDLGGSVQLQNCYMDYGATPYSNLARNAERIRQVMDILADETNYPVFYHCRIGTARTGITGMMIGGLLGIPFNEVFQDYCFSNFAPIDGLRYPNKPSDPNGDDPAKYIDEILAMPGATYQEQTYNALLSIGCKAEKLNKIIDFMTEGEKAELGVKGAVKTADQLTSDGTKKTSTDYKNPATYYECGSGKKASMTATFTAGEKDVVIYLGSTDSSQSSKFADKITLKIDGTQNTIANTKTMHQAGFGTTGQNSRTGYMFNMLGKFDLTAGEHTIEISIKSGTFNIGTIAVFDHVTPTK